MENWYEALEHLAGLRERGVLTDEEFAAEKARILSRRDDSEQPPKPLRSAIWLQTGRTKIVGGAIATAVLLGGGLAYFATRDIAGSGADARAEGHGRAVKATPASIPLKPNASLD